MFFKTAFVFELSQTEPLPGAEPVALQAPCEPLTGDSHAHLLAPLGAFAQSLGYTVVVRGDRRARRAAGATRSNKRIVVDADVPANAQLRTLIHEMRARARNRL